jgi:two-component system chemotaxis response regulator CheY
MVYDQRPHSGKLESLFDGHLIRLRFRQKRIGEMKILIVDDSDICLKMVRHFFPPDLLGEIVTEAHDGAEALAILATGTFDILITDYDMPKVNGLELVRKISAGEVSRPVAILFVTATPHPDLEFELAKLGIPMATKPITGTMIAALLATAKRTSIQQA